MGEVTGDIMLTPLRLAWGRCSTALARKTRSVQAAALASTARVVGAAIFGGFGAIRDGHYPGARALCARVVWAALRFGVRGGIALSLIVCVFALWGTPAAGGALCGGRWGGHTGLRVGVREPRHRHEGVACQRAHAAIVPVREDRTRIVWVTGALEALTGHRWV